MTRSWTPGKMYRRKDGELAEFVGLKDYALANRVMKVPAFSHPTVGQERQELIHYWYPTIPFVTHDLRKDTELYGDMCIVEDDTKQPSCC